MTGIHSIASAILYVGDQDEALRFYRDTLGFDVVRDVDMGEGSRWIELKPAEGQTSIVLSSADVFDKAPGDGAYLTFASDDVAATAAELKARGADVSDVVDEPWGTYATVSAPDGHQLQFNQRPTS